MSGKIIDMSGSHGNCYHFPDLAEIRSGYLNGDEDFSQVKSEFVFCTTGTTVGEGQVQNILKAGFKEVGAMKNWHWIHHNEWTKPIRLFWKRLYSVKDAEPVPKNLIKPRHFSAAHENICKYHESQVPYLQWNGCGMKLGEKPTRHSFYRYFGLLRLPLKPSPRILRWLEYANYRLIATGSKATFWNNGWLNAEDWSVKKERAFWIKRGICFVEAHDFTYVDLPSQHRKKYTPGLRVRLTEYIKAGGNPHNMFLDPNICPEKYGNGLKYSSSGNYTYTPTHEGLAPLTISPSDLTQLSKDVHFFGKEKICVKCNISEKDAGKLIIPPAKGRRKAAKRVA